MSYTVNSKNLDELRKKFPNDIDEILSILYTQRSADNSINIEGDDVVRNISEKAQAAALAALKNSNNDTSVEKTGLRISVNNEDAANFAQQFTKALGESNVIQSVMATLEKNKASLEEQAKSQKQAAELNATSAEILKKYIDNGIKEDGNFINTANGRVASELYQSVVKDYQDNFDKSLQKTMAIYLSGHGGKADREGFFRDKEEISANRSAERHYFEESFREAFDGAAEDLEKELADALRDFDRKTKEMIQESAAEHGVDKSKTSENINDLISEFNNSELGSALGKIPGDLGSIVNIVSAISTGLDTLTSAMDEGINKAMNLTSQYLGSVDSHLAGIWNGLTFEGDDGIASWLSENFTASMWVNQEKLMENISSLADQGLVANIEERALIETIKDKMVASFEVQNETLNRLIKLQQVDLTAQGLGMEGELTELFNGMFTDSSYLATHVDDTVESILTNALSQFNSANAASYEFDVQKWLGSLYSVGMSQEAVTKIATGIGYLTTGDTTSLTGDSQLMTLFSMAAKNAGLSMAEILTEGISGSGVNALMQSMVEYLQSIAENTDNQVTKAAWSDILGIDLSDLRAVQNLTSSDIAKISSTSMTQSEMIDKFTEELSLVEERTSTADKIANLISNVELAFGQDFLSQTSTVEKKATWDPNTSETIYYEESSGDSGLYNYLGWQLSKTASSLGGIFKLGGSLSQLFMGVDSMMDTFYNAVDSLDKYSSSAEYISLFSDVLDTLYSRGTSYEGITGVSVGATSASALTGGTTVSNSNVLSGVTESTGYSFDNSNVVIAEGSSSTYTTFADNAATVTASTVSGSGSTDSDYLTSLYRELFINHSDVYVYVDGYSEGAAYGLSENIRSSIVSAFNNGDIDMTFVPTLDSSSTLTSASATIASVRG